MHRLHALMALALAGLALLCGLVQACSTAGAPAVATIRAESPGVWPLGLELGALSPAEGRAAGIGERAALVVRGVAAGGSAAAAGLRAGDLLLAAQGHALSGLAEFDRLLSGLPRGGSINLRVWRQGGQLELVLDSAPAPAGRPGPP
jgi:membrane-associated protease RseP (regulator of RpoE activity)